MDIRMSIRVHMQTNKLMVHLPIGFHLQQDNLLTKPNRPLLLCLCIHSHTHHSIAMRKNHIGWVLLYNSYKHINI